MRMLFGPPPDGRGPSRAAVLALALVVVLATGFLAFAVPYTPGRLQHPAAALFVRVPLWRFLAEHRPALYDQPGAFAAALLLACGAGYGACALGVRLLWSAPWRRDLLAIVIGAGALGTSLTLLAPPNLNSNVWNYALRGRVASAHGENPYVTPADAFPDDPLYPYANHAYTGTAGDKLAAWALCNVAFTYLGGDDPVRTLFVYRGGLLLFSFGSLILLAVAARHAEPRRALAGMVLWAWNPIVLMNSLARTDTLMLLYFLIAILLYLRGRRRLGVVALTLSVYVKLITGPLLAVIALAEARARRWKELLIAALLVLATTVVVWAPFYHHNLHRLVTDYTDNAVTAPSPAHGALKAVAGIGFAALILIVGWTRRRDDLKHLLSGMMLVQIYFSLFFAKFASADYLLTLLALVAVTMDWRSVLTAFALGASYFLFDEWYLVGARNFLLPDLFPFSRGVVFTIPLVAAVLVIVGVVAWRRHRSPATS